MCSKYCTVSCVAMDACCTVQKENKLMTPPPEQLKEMSTVNINAFNAISHNYYNNKTELKLFLQSCFDQQYKTQRCAVCNDKRENPA